MIILEWLKAKLKKEFEMSDLGSLKFCLGVALNRDYSAHNITLRQDKYMKEVLRRFRI